MKKEYDFAGARRGAVLTRRGKTRITIYVDDDVMDAFRERAESEGHGYQTLINQAPREHLAMRRKPVDEATLRRVLREEMAGTK